MRLACELPRPLKDEGEVPTCLEAFQAQLEGLATHFDRCIRWLDAPFGWARFECGRSIRVGLGDALPQLDRKGGVARSQLWELSKVVAAGPRKKGEIWEMWGATYGRNGWVGEKQIPSGQCIPRYAVELCGPHAQLPPALGREPDQCARRESQP